MRNFTKQITNKTLFKPTRWLLMALMLLLGTSGAWAETVYYVNSNSWNKVSVYYWNGNKNVTWPGSDMISTGEYVDGYEVFSFDIGSCSLCIFSNGGSNQTGDLNVQAGKYYYNGSWKSKSELHFCPKAQFPIGNTDVLYYDNSESKWSSCYVYVGHHSYTKIFDMSLVSGTRYLYKATTFGTWNDAKGWYISSEKWDGYPKNECIIGKACYHSANAFTFPYESDFTSGYIYKGSSTATYASNDCSTSAYTWSNTKVNYATTYTITLNIVGSGKVTIKNNAGTALFTNAAAATQTKPSVGYLTYLKNITATPSNGYELSSIKIGNTDYTEAYKSGNDTQSGYDLTGNVTITVTFDCTTPTATRKINSVNYNGCDKVNVVLSGAINDPIYGMLVRYEGTKTSSQITAPTDGTTYNLNDEIGEGVVVAYGMTNASQFQNMPMPDVTTVYTFAYYEYHKNCKYYVLAGDLKTTELRTPTVTTADATNVNGANATLGGTYVKQGSGAGIEYYGIIWTEKPAGSTLQDINKAGSVGVGNSFTVDVTFDVSGTYKYKAFINSNATGDCEIGYGEEKSVTISVCTRPVIVTNSTAYNPSTGLVDINYSISETGGATTHYGIQYRAKDNNFPTEDLDDSDFIKIGTTSNTVTNATYTYQTVLTPGTYYFRTYANNGCPDFDYSVGMVYGEEIQVVVPKKDQPTLTLTGVKTTYCTVPNEPITLSTTGGDGNGAVSYQIVNDGTTATASITTNQLSITSAGTLNLKAIKAEDTNFSQAESAVVTVTIYADIEAGIISATPTTVCQGGEVTLILSGHTADAKITWYADDAQVATGNATYTASNLQETTSYKVEVTRQDGSCDLKTEVTDAFQILVDQTSDITLSGNGAALCNGRTVDLTQLESSAIGTVTWYTDQAGTQEVASTTVTVNGNATYYAKAKNGECPATEAAPYAITAKGVTIINQSPATVHPYEVTTFTASGNASWEISTNPSEGAALDNNDPVFSGKTTAYITKADGNTTTFKGETATDYVIKATADDCETTHTFNVEDDPDNCKQ